jgi:hypothetical protein
MTEFLHETVAKREAKETSTRTSLIEMLERIVESYRQSYAPDTRGINAIDFVMRSRDNISIGSTIQIPVMPMNAVASTSYTSNRLVYTYTGDTTGTYRGWVRTS